MRVLRVYVGAQLATLKIAASLDGTSGCSDTSLTAGSSIVNGVYTLTFRGSSPGQLLTVKVSTSNTTGDAAISLEAATLALAPVTAATTYDDDGSSAGGSAIFSHSSGWTRCPSTCDPSDTPSTYYNHTSTSSNAPGNTLTVTFNGTHIDLYGVKRPDGGYATVTISGPSGNVPLDSGAATDTIDFYGPAPRNGNVWMWSSPTLPTLTSGAYTLTLTVSNANNINSGDYYVAVDRVDIQP